MPVALGFIETNSLFGAAEAANVMAKTSNIIVLEKEVISTGSIAIKIIGEEGAVETAINSGTEAIKKLEKNVSSHIIVDPDEQVFSVFPEMRSLYYSFKRISKRKIKKVETEKTKIESEKSKAETDKPKAVTKKIKAVSKKPRVKTKKQKTKTQKRTAKNKKKKLKIVKPKVKIRKPKVKTVKSKAKTEKPKAKTIKSVGKTKKPEAGLKKTKVKTSQPELANPETEIKKIEKPEIEKKDQEPEKVLNGETTLQETEDIFIVHWPERKLRTSPIKKAVEEKRPEIKERRRTSYRNDTIERLRKEALGLNKKDKEKPVSKEIKSKKETKKMNKESHKDSDLQSLNVHELRKLARNKKNFPIQGREISKAKREVLLAYFQNLK
jgi:microcompartment protein CcmL/EutN